MAKIHDSLEQAISREMELWAARKREREANRDGLRLFAIRFSTDGWVRGTIRRNGVSLVARTHEDAAQRFRTRDEAQRFIARHKANNPDLASAEVRAVIP